MKKIFFYALIASSLFADVLQENYTKQEFNEIDNRSGEEIAKIWAENENKNLPKKMDNYTKLTKAIAINTKIYYTKEITKNKTKNSNEILSNNEKKEELLKEMYQNTRKDLCKNPINRAYLDKKNLGMQIDYYESENKKYIGSFSIDKSDCIKLEQEEKQRGIKNPLL